MWNHPLTTVNHHSLIGQAIALCGGENIVPHAYGSAPEINLETVLAARPDVIISSASNSEKMWYPWRTIPAVAFDHVYTIDPDVLQQPSPEIMVGVKQLCEDIHRTV